MNSPDPFQPPAPSFSELNRAFTTGRRLWVWAAVCFARYWKPATAGATGAMAVAAAARGDLTWLLHLSPNDRFEGAMAVAIVVLWSRQISLETWCRTNLSKMLAAATDAIQSADRRLGQVEGSMDGLSNKVHQDLIEVRNACGAPTPAPEPEPGKTSGLIPHPVVPHGVDGLAITRRMVPPQIGDGDASLAGTGPKD